MQYSYDRSIKNQYYSMLIAHRTRLERMKANGEVDYHTFVNIKPKLQSAASLSNQMGFTSASVKQPDHIPVTAPIRAPGAPNSFKVINPITGKEVDGRDSQHHIYQKYWSGVLAANDKGMRDRISNDRVFQFEKPSPSPARWRQD